jgi:endonuclease/exonuclease/phosphatase family metal-dependent hydrolase
MQVKVKKLRNCSAAAFLMAPFFLLAGCFGGCEVYPESKAGEGRAALSVAAWNVQALFDGKDDGWEYEEYRDGSGWTEEKYAARLNGIAKALEAMGEKTPDILAFIEVENAGVLQRLHEEYLRKQGYKYAFFTGNSGRSLGIGVLSKLPFVKTMAHSINVLGDVIPRPVGELWFDAAGQRLVVFVCHWKSKLGGEESTEKQRREAAKIIVRRQRELCAASPQTAILVLGDLNENYDEFYRRGSEQVCALLPDDPEAARRSGFALPDAEDAPANEVELPEARRPQDFLILSGEKPPESAFFDSADGIFYSPWGNELRNGSYFYSGEWETIDHFLLNGAFFDKTGLEFQNCFVMDCEPFVNSKGEPDRYNPRTGAGLSDHLPLFLTLSRL